MDALPIELVEQILGLACADAGRTMCALRSTSRSLRAACDPFRFHTVAVTTHRQITAFLAAFTQSSPPAQASVRHLFVVICGFSIEPGNQILRATARTVETLALVCTARYKGLPAHDALLQTAFPRLVALTVRYRAIYLHAVMARSPPAPVPTLPRLRYLHVAPTDTASLGFAQTCIFVFARCAGPRLLRVRISRVRGTETLSEALEEVLGLRPGRGVLPPLPTGIRYFILDLYWRYGAVQNVVETLETLERRAAEERAIHLRVLHEIRPAGKTPVDWEEEWLRVQTGEVDMRAEWLEDHGERLVAAT
ncbi:hypothetical protein GLOTRDRAFT_125110 [Gloeophyllum trabeum ATCC 11539]|uniref:F-box domain-containing protein n=1 Tax=Gloeophyllum trabeum (strain ATCC 11539 / FP-39264 / Madison 617) TaxID=670483 RepID=S7RVF9_GLOTA|nr:uncharacterized protein GLOTRDRAFT_125110 [Gloeophyllum trabeum ATCC 11539]EPQ58780.1 hypothetical protein GLOTRDRAFT_125110 [Gloeophyllum trabeum ATCC 11539]